QLLARMAAALRPAAGVSGSRPSRMARDRRSRGEDKPGTTRIPRAAAAPSRLDRARGAQLIDRAGPAHAREIRLALELWRRFGDAMPVITCIEALRLLHRKRAPRAFYEYVDAGSYTEGTYRANTADLAALKLRQRVAVDIDGRSTESTMLGQKVAMPVALAPVGSTGMQWANGEILAARAAEKFGVPFTLSTMSICSIEDVAAATTAPFWFQLYVMRDRDFVKRLIVRAKAAGCSALVLTLDLQVLGQRHKDLKNGLTVPPEIRLSNVLDLLSKPGWALRMIGAKRKVFGNLVGHVQGVGGIVALAEWTAHQFDPTLDWRDVEWVRNEWGGKLILKGIQDVDDAKTAVSLGADAIVVSNHGGRQLDGAISSIRA